MLKIIFLKKINIILIYFQTKNILKNNCYKYPHVRKKYTVVFYKGTSFLFLFCMKILEVSSGLTLEEEYFLFGCFDILRLLVSFCFLSAVEDFLLRG